MKTKNKRQPEKVSTGLCHSVMGLYSSIIDRLLFTFFYEVECDFSNTNGLFA